MKTENNSLFSDEDIERWQSAAERFKAFASDKEVKQELSEMTIEDIGILKFLFLGEKPAIALEPTPAISAALRKEGFILSKQFVYNQDLCQTEMDKHKDLFSDFKNPSLVFEHLDKEFCLDESSIDTVRVGVLLGFPRSDSECYRQVHLQYRLLLNELRELLGVNENELQQILTYGGNMTPKYDRIRGSKVEVLCKEPPHEVVSGLSEEKVSEALKLWEDYRSKRKQQEQGRIGAEVHGNIWARYDENQESVLKEARLDTAMRISGMLDV